MGRLTWKKPNGDWGIKGVDFSEVRPAYGALCKLLAYENTGLSPDEVERLKDDLDDWKEAHRWIPVAERLPESGQEVLTYIKHNYAEDGWRAYRVYEYTDHFVGMGNLCSVLAWMPLPEPYKEET